MYTFPALGRPPSIGRTIQQACALIQVILSAASPPQKSSLAPQFEGETPRLFRYEQRAREGAAMCVGEWESLKLRSSPLTAWVPRAVPTAGEARYRNTQWAGNPRASMTGRRDAPWESVEPYGALICVNRSLRSKRVILSQPSSTRSWDELCVLNGSNNPMPVLTRSACAGTSPHNRRVGSTGCPPSTRIVPSSCWGDQFRPVGFPKKSQVACHPKALEPTRPKGPGIKCVTLPVWHPRRHPSKRGAEQWREELKQ